MSLHENDLYLEARDEWLAERNFPQVMRDDKGEFVLIAGVKEYLPDMLQEGYDIIENNEIY